MARKLHVTTSHGSSPASWGRTVWLSLPSLADAGWESGGARLGFLSSSVDAEPGRSSPDPSSVTDCYWSESELHLEKETRHLICRVTGATWWFHGVGTSCQLYGCPSVLESWFISGDIGADEP